MLFFCCSAIHSYTFFFLSGEEGVELSLQPEMVSTSDAVFSLEDNEEEGKME